MLPASGDAGLELSMEVKQNSLLFIKQVAKQQRVRNVTEGKSCSRQPRNWQNYCVGGYQPFRCNACLGWTCIRANQA